MWRNGGLAIQKLLLCPLSVLKKTRTVTTPSHEEVRLMMQKRGKEILEKKILRETVVVNETARKVVMDRMNAPRCSVDVICAKSGMGKATVINTMGKEAVEKGILEGFYILSMSDIVKKSDKMNFASIIAQGMGAPPNFKVHRLSDMIEDNKIVGIHIDQAELLAKHPSGRVEEFVLALSGDAANSHKFRLYLSTTDPFFAETLPQLNGYTKVFPLFDLDTPFPRWDKGMLATHLKEEVVLDRFIEVTDEQQRRFIDIVISNGVLGPGAVDQGLDILRRRIRIAPNEGVDGGLDAFQRIVDKKKDA